MPDCAELQRLKRAATDASRHFSTLLKEYGRLRAITGFSEKQACELLERAQEAKLAADAVVAEHGATHGCERPGNLVRRAASLMGNNLDQQGESLRSRSVGVDHSGLVHRKYGIKQGGRLQLFSGILPGDYTVICAAARVTKFKRGEMLYFEGDAVQQVLLLTSGSAKMNKFGMSGTEVILRLAVPGEVLGVLGLLSTGRHCTTAQAFRSGRALVWDAHAFKALAEGFPRLRQNMARILCEDVLELEERFRELATQRIGPRVARQLVRLREQIGRPVNGGVEIGISRAELAQMTGTTLFSVSRLLSGWEARGMLNSRREAVTVCDVQSLGAMGEES